MAEFDTFLDARDREDAQKFVAQVTRSSRSQALILANLQVAHASLWEGLEEEALAAMDLAAKKAEEVKALDANMAVGNMMAKVLLGLGKEEEARDHIDQILVKAKAEGSRKWEAVSLITTAEIEIASGDLETASRYLDRSQVILKEVGSVPQQELRAMLLMVDVHVKRGKLDLAIGLCKTADTLASSKGKLYEAEALSKLAYCYLLFNDTQEAQYTAKAAQEASKEAGEFHRWEVEALETWMEAQLAESKPEQAIETCREVIEEILKEISASLLLEVRWRLKQASILRDMGKYPDALPAAARCLELMTSSRANRKLCEKMIPEAEALVQEVQNAELAGEIWGLAQESLRYTHDMNIQIMPNYSRDVLQQYRKMMGSPPAAA